MPAKKSAKHASADPLVKAEIAKAKAARPTAKTAAKAAAPKTKHAAKGPVIVSGIQPSGKLHVGNYLGMARNWLALQAQGRHPMFFIADYHSITGNYSAEEKRAEVLEMATSLLALGIDPKKCTLFVQSHVPEHTELAWIFNTLTPVSFLERMTQFKDKSARQNENVNMGLFDYPVLQAADVLLYKGAEVPVGQDQVQHVELTRDIARFFNQKYCSGDNAAPLFPETKPLLTATPKVRSLTEPLKKMSKSHGERSYISLTDTPDEILEKLKRAVTESTGMVSMSEAEVQEAIAALGGADGDERLRGMAGVWNLIDLLRAFGKEGEADRMLAQQPIRYGDLKTLIATRIAEYFAAFRKRHAALSKDPAKVKRILAEGAKKASAIAKANMKEVRTIIGVR